MIEILMTFDVDLQVFKYFATLKVNKQRHHQRLKVVAIAA